MHYSYSNRFTQGPTSNNDFLRINLPARWTLKIQRPFFSSTTDFYSSLYPNKKLSTFIITPYTLPLACKFNRIFHSWLIEWFFLYFVLPLSLTCRTKHIENDVSIIKERGTKCASLGSEILRSHHKHCVMFNRNTPGVTLPSCCNQGTNYFSLDSWDDFRSMSKSYVLLIYRQKRCILKRRNNYCYLQRVEWDICINP